MSQNGGNITKRDKSLEALACEASVNQKHSCSIFTLRALCNLFAWGLYLSS